MKNSFLVMTENATALNMLKDSAAGALFKALMAHATGQEVQKLPFGAELLYQVMAGQMDRMDERYEAVKKKRIEAGRAGGLAKSSNAKQNLANAKQSLASCTSTCTSSRKKNTFFDFDQRTDVDLDEIVRKEV